MSDESDDFGGFNRSFQWVCEPDMSGYILQEIWRTETYGTADVAVEYEHNSHYWEAWEVRNGLVLDANGASLAGAPHDSWYNAPSADRIGKVGSWAMKGNVFWSEDFNPAAEGFSFGGVPEAGSLLSSLSGPMCHLVGQFDHSRGRVWDARPTEEFARRWILFLRSDFDADDITDELQNYGFTADEARRHVKTYITS
ncbi:hypothetical protein ACIQMR_33510 [Streptomyces sp. NPDC091376]|uniref:hypothetical protein n=1 Tax=Streptomyces sp. NPDC091376 TaxID=3365994 RepID=UPI003830DA13